MNKKALLVVNFHSGTGKSREALPGIIEILSDAGTEVSVYSTKNKLSTIQKVKNSASSYDSIIAVGGDGTLSETVNGVMLAGSDVAVGYVPVGSTNDTARSLGLPTDYIAAAKIIAKGTTKKYDIGSYNDRYFTYIAATGAFTKTSYATSQSLKNSLGHLAYVLEGIKSVGEIEKIRISGITDAGSFSGEYLFCSVSNSTSVGGMIHLKSTEVKFDDGLFELCLIAAPHNPAELVALLGDLVQQKFENRLISIRHIRSATITLPRASGWTLDGEDGGEQSTVNFSVCEGALNLLTEC